MKGWLTVLLSGLITTIIVIGTGLGRSAHVPTSPARPAPASPARVTGAPVRTFSQWLDYSQVAATSARRWATIARHNDIVVLNSWDYRLIPVLKRANPKVQVWVYKDLSGIRSDDCTTTNGRCGSCARGVMDSGFLSSGMGYCWVLRNYPDWLLRSAATGQRFEFRGYSRIWETDYGNAGYQRQWIRNVLADVRGHGWDGVEIDNALTTADAYGVAAKYPSSPQVQAATYSALREIGPALRRAGVLSVANVGDAMSFPGLWQRWLGPLTGLEQEFYLSGSGQPGAMGNAWQAYQDEVSACVAQRKSCWFHSGGYSTSVASRTSEYALASYLLATDGRQFLAVGNATSAPLARCWALGVPLSSMKQTGLLWRRSFAGGIAVVNPTGTRLHVSLTRSYLDRAGNAVAAVTVGPGSGSVFGTARRGCH
jgi:hypothetical protein